MQTIQYKLTAWLSLLPNRDIPSGTYIISICKNLSDQFYVLNLRLFVLRLSNCKDIEFFLFLTIRFIVKAAVALDINLTNGVQPSQNFTKQVLIVFTLNKDSLDILHHIST